MLRKPYTMISHRGSAFASSLSIRCDHQTTLSTSVLCFSDHSTLKEDCHRDLYSCKRCYSIDNSVDLLKVPQLDSSCVFISSCRNVLLVLPTESNFQTDIDVELKRETTNTPAEWRRRWSAWISRCSLHNEKAECKDVISHRMHLHLPSCRRRCF